MHDDQQIRTIWARMAEGWAAGEATAFAADFATDCDFTTVRGDRHHGRTEVAAGHDRLFHSVYRGTTLRAEIHRIRTLRPGLSTVDVDSSVVGPDGTVIASTHALAVVEQSNGQWQIIAFHNMVPVRPT
ncbi:SgcJ/EcaC family oxidoreductase [Streptomyces canus]|uniref:SgcJ/EcaC family oxidoreductase n=1 Tax=Streptomyces canus TaxID=58343 RepID=UPI0036AE96FA